MKKVNKITIIAIIYIGLMLISTKVFAANTGKTINDTTRIREKATTSSETVTVISTSNTQVNILSKDGDWYKVEYTKNKIQYTGYIRKDLLKVDSEENEENPKTEETTDETATSENTEETSTTQNSKETESVVETVSMEIEEGVTVKTNAELEVKILPLINSNSNEKVAKSTNVTVTEILGNWVYIESEEQNGWVMTSKLQSTISSTENSEETKNTKEAKKEEKKEETKKENEEDNNQGNKTLYVNTDTLNVRKEAKTNSAVLKQLSKSDKVTLVKKVDNTWSKIKAGDVTGFVASEYLVEKKSQVSSRSAEEIRKEKEKEEQEQKQAENAETKKEESTKKTETKSETTSTSSNKTETKSTTTTKTETETKKEESKTTTSGVTGSDIVAYAKKYLGYPYVYGTNGPKTFDCSGFTSYVYKHFGYSLSRTSGGQRSNGKEVKKANLQPGDIVCFSGHVGIYIGGNNFIHAANAKKGIIITSLSNSYYAKTYITARRIIN